MKTKSPTYRFKTLHRFDTGDATLLILRAEWTHGIYGTAEAEVFSVFVEADGTDTIIWKDGTAEEMDERQEFHQLISQYITDSV